MSLARRQQEIENDASQHASADGCDEHGKESANKSDAYRRNRECEHGAHAHHQHHHERLHTPILHMTTRMERAHANAEREAGQLGKQDRGGFWRTGSPFADQPIALRVPRFRGKTLSACLSRITVVVLCKYLHSISRLVILTNAREDRQIGAV